MSTLRLTVIVISCNQHDFVNEALSSILHDKMAPLEVICVDDASTDGTDAVIERWARADARVQLIRHGKAGKPSVLRNAGIAHATGEWISFLDGDDLYHCDRYAILSSAEERSFVTPDIIVHDYKVFADGDPPEEGRVGITDAIREQLYRSVLGISKPDRAAGTTDLVLDGNRLAVFMLSNTFVLNTATQIIRRSMLLSRSVVYDESVTFGEDNLFILQCVVSSTILFVQRPLSFYRKHSRSLTAVRTLSAQRELVASMVRQVAVLRRSPQPVVSARDWSGIKQRLLEEMLHLGYLLETAGRRGAAFIFYLKVCVQQRSVHAALRATKALVRPL